MDFTGIDVSFVELNSGGLGEINDIINELERGKEIHGGLTITGHTYWVVLEYGSSPAESDPQPKRTDPILLNVPDDIQAPQHHSQWYPIRARYKKKLKFIDSNGRLRFQYAVRHPGIKGRGFIRRTIFAMEPLLGRALDELLQDNIFPTRRELVAVVNAYLRSLCDAVIEATPVQETDEEGFDITEEEGHLKDAISVDLAH